MNVVVNVVLGQLGDPGNPGRLNAGALFPESAYRDPRELLYDPVFVTGEERP